MSDVRLIDANALEKTAIPCEIHNGASTELCVPLYQIRTAPTVEVPENTVNCVLTNFGDCSYNKTGCSDCEVKNKIRKALENERPTGEWYYSCQKGWHCSICQQTVKDMPTVMGKANFDYCPNCGARMGLIEFRAELNIVKKWRSPERKFNPFDHRGITEI